MPSNWYEGRSEGTLGGLYFGEAGVELSGNACAAALLANVTSERRERERLSRGHFVCVNRSRMVGCRLRAPSRSWRFDDVAIDSRSSSSADTTRACHFPNANNNTTPLNLYHNRTQVVTWKVLSGLNALSMKRLKIAELYELRKMWKYC